MNLRLPTRRLCIVFAFCIAGMPHGASGRVQQSQPDASQPDTLRLSAARTAAAQQDPRTVVPDLLAEASRLRQAALRAQRRPQVTLSGQATAQNEVAEIPIDLPNQNVPSPPHEQFRAQVATDWLLYDGGRTRSQAAVERARLGEEVAGVAVTLYALREATTETYFGALLSAAQAQTLSLAADDLAARLRVVQRQAEAGAALASQVAAFEAEQIRIQQQIEQAEATQRAARNVLAQLTGIALEPSDVLAVPDLSAEVQRALLVLDLDSKVAGDESTVLQRPELARFEWMAQRAEAEARAREVQTRPTLSLFGQAGLGRPSPFNFLSDDVAEYGQAGVRVQWTLFDAGRARREAEALRVQARRAEVEAAAFVRQIARDIEDERAELDRLDRAISADERAVSLREEVLRVAHRQLEEGVLLPDVYTDRLTDLSEARLILEQHRIMRAQAQARLLSILGAYPESRTRITDLHHFD